MAADKKYILLSFQSPIEFVLSDSSMTELTPNYTVNFIDESVIRADGKLMRSIDITAKMLNTPEYFKSIEIICSAHAVSPPYGSLNKFKDLLNGYIDQIVMLILKNPSKQLLNDIAMLSEGTKEMTQLHVENMPESVTFTLPRLKHLITTPSDLVKIHTLDVERLTLTAAHGDTITLDDLIKFVKQNVNLKRLLFTYPTTIGDVVLGEESASSTQLRKLTIVNVVEELLSGEPRKYDYLLLANTANDEVFGIDTENMLLQTSEFGLINECASACKHWRIFIARDQGKKISQLLPTYAEAIESLYIRVHEAEAVTVTPYFSGFPRKLTIQIYAVDENMRKQTTLDRISTHNGVAKMSLRNGLLSKFIPSNTESLHIDGNMIAFTLANEIADNLRKLPVLRVLDLYSERLSLCILEYAASGEEFKMLDRLYLHRIRAAEVHKHPSIFEKKSLNLVIIRDVQYEEFLDSTIAVEEPPNWNVAIIVAIQRVAFEKRTMVST